MEKVTLNQTKSRSAHLRFLAAQALTAGWIFSIYIEDTRVLVIYWSFFPLCMLYKNIEKKTYSFSFLLRKNLHWGLECNYEMELAIPNCTKHISNYIQTQRNYDWWNKVLVLSGPTDILCKFYFIFMYQLLLLL